ncbi:MAG TPA: ShlB/FhaC/HecB family hemolysin secretion/activation protein [Bryobacteraceae bacterium]|nr:ShlB/FhaC/HecB family hemolysin secretion/activation protein [Bryobacteraceae bacterium]
MASVAVEVGIAPAAAAPVNLPGAVQPGHERQLPQPEAPPQKFDFSVEAPHRSPVPRAVDEIKFKLVDIRIVGTRTLPASQFRPLYQNLIGKEISLSNIFDVADGIEKEYRDAGYLLVRAYVPPQHVSDGIFTINVVEGFVENTSVQGADSGTQRIVKSYLAPVLGERPLRLATIERALLMSNDLPGVAATGVLRPSVGVAGASDLVVTMTQPEITGGLSATNRGSHFSGIWTVTGNAEYNGIFGGDELDATLTMAPHAIQQQVSGQLRYRKALDSDGLVGSLIGAASHGAPSGSIGGAQIRTDSWAAGPRLSYPFIRTREETFSFDGGFTVQEAKVKILGAPINHDNWRVLDAGLTYASRDFLSGDFASTIDVAQGLPLFGASSNHSPNLSLFGRSVFTKITGLVRYTNTTLLPDQFSFAVTGTGQYAANPLITGEQILFGGTQIGRGYDPGAITGDSGIGGSFELRYDTRYPDWDIRDIQPYAFFDAAKVWNRARPPAAGIPLGNFTIDSTGIGIRFWLPYNIYWDVEGARTLHAVPGSDSGKRVTKFLTDIAITF